MENKTLDQFFAELPTTGWTFRPPQQIVRADDCSICPALFVDGLNQSDRWRVYAAADNNTWSGLFDPDLRQRLLDHCRPL